MSLFTGVLEELVGGRLGIDPLRGVVAPFVTQYTHEFGGQCLIKHVENPV